MGSELKIPDGRRHRWRFRLSAALMAMTFVGILSAVVAGAFGSMAKEVVWQMLLLAVNLVGFASISVTIVLVLNLPWILGLLLWRKWESRSRQRCESAESPEIIPYSAARASRHAAP